MKMLVNGHAFEVDVLERTRSAVTFRISEKTYRVEFQASIPATAASPQALARELTPAGSSNPAATPSAPSLGSGQIAAPIPGVVVELLVAVGDTVEAGQVLLRVEAMKMQNNIFAPFAGTIASVSVAVGQEVRDGELLVEVVSA